MDRACERLQRQGGLGTDGAWWEAWGREGPERAGGTERKPGQRRAGSTLEWGKDSEPHTRTTAMSGAEGSYPRRGSRRRSGSGGVCGPWLQPGRGAEGAGAGAGAGPRVGMPQARRVSLTGGRP